MCVIGNTILRNTLQPIRSCVTCCRMVWDITSHKIFFLGIYHHKNLKSDVDCIHFALNYTKCRIQWTAHYTRPCNMVHSGPLLSSIHSLLLLCLILCKPYPKCLFPLPPFQFTVQNHLLISFRTIIQWSKYPPQS